MEPLVFGEPDALGCLKVEGFLTTAPQSSGAKAASFSFELRVVMNPLEI